MSGFDPRIFVRTLSQMQARLERIESGLKQPSLGNSSIQDDYLHVYDALGQVRQRIGKQTDGTFGVAYQNGDAPPVPTLPTVAPRQLSLAVFWDGTFNAGVDARPTDFLRVDVHVSTTAGFTPDATTLYGSLNAAGAVSFVADSETHYVRLVAVNTSGVASTATDTASALPLPASVIAAGSIGAEQLAAEIVISNKFVAGDPNGARLEVAASGIDQYNASGGQTIHLGDDPSQGNFLSVPDPADPTHTLATLADNGALAVQSLNVIGDAKFGGISLSDTIAKESGGCVARAEFGSDGSSSPSTTSETAWFEVAFTATGGRLYRIQSGPFISHGGGADVRLRYTTDGSAPSTSSPRLTRCGASDGETVPPLSFVGSFNDGAHVRILLSVYSWSGASVFVGVVDAQAAQFWVEDIGVDPGNTGSLINSGGGGGGGTQPMPKTTYTKTWNAVWTRGFNAHGIRGDGQLVQGYYDDGFNGDNTLMIGFDDIGMRADLSGAVINSVSVFLYSWHWYFNSGGFAAIGTHNVAFGPPGAYSVVNWGITEAHMPKPGGVWMGIPAWVGEQFRDNLVKGINLDAIYRGHDLNYYGKFNGATDPWPPAIAINYTK